MCVVWSVCVYISPLQAKLPEGGHQVSLYRSAQHLIKTIAGKVFHNDQGPQQREPSANSWVWVCVCVNIVYRCIRVMYMCVVNLCVSGRRYLRQHRHCVSVCIRLLAGHVCVPWMWLLVGSRCVCRRWVSEPAFMCVSVLGVCQHHEQECISIGALGGCSVG